MKIIQNKLFFILALFLVSNMVFSQDYSADWKGHFSFLNIQSVSRGETKIYVASDNAIFSFDIVTREMEQITTINGLSGELITTIYYSEAYRLVLVGFENGLMEIIFEDDDDILSIVDIKDKPNIAPDRKRINHFNLIDNLVYVATDYGISVYDIQNLEFGDTFFIGNGGAQISVKQTTFFNDHIYAACYNENGIKKALISSPDLIDYQQWESLVTGNYTFIQEVDNNLYAIRANRVMYKIDTDDRFLNLFRYSVLPNDMVSISDKLLVSTKDNVFVYDRVLNTLATVNQIDNYPTEFSCATIFENDKLYLGTKNIINQGKPGFGILETNLNDLTSFNEIHPDGPLLNTVFSVEIKNSNLWCTFGGYSASYAFQGNTYTGISHYVNEQWINKPYDSILAVVDEPRYISHIAINPFNINQVYVSSYYSGLIEILNDEVIDIYDENNSTIIPFAAELCLTLTANYDSQGALWVTNGRVESPLNRFKDGSWSSYDLTGIISSPTSNLGFSDIVFDRSGNVFFGSYSAGIIGLNLSGNGEFKNIVDDSQNMPTPYVTSVAMDKNNQVWIGTSNGLRVLYNTTSFFSESNPQVQDIIILEDGVPKELLYQQFVSDIEVDGANNKWIAAIGSGVFYFSADGQNTIRHFTKDNSPLPSNDVVDITIDEINGDVYFATRNGLVSFGSGSSETQQTLANAYVYPNPVRPTFNITEEKVKIKDISENVNIKITDIEGNLVAEAQSRTNSRYKGYNLEIDGGIAYWNGNNLANNVVKTGVYLVMLSDLDTFETKVIKVMVVR
ncbi:MULTISPECIES: type IX secretion system anionic LPS delivery protein PorZ [Bizionia]|uniref:ABC transporter substrate-binding protein n=1 Tax=Bizionia algoritergicola TaxID=291187 RepID=A0A5D0R1I7_9FLAO|nr:MULTISPECIES: two-component regulator propeller domain-containing protein [Bizionia]OBX23519.1 ABC transporter substrate-binding protein [Bizionia sp. APA-3]TYB74949.1 ABC transporter substrate-binding protein [Bizionia algoritergicola]